VRMKLDSLIIFRRIVVALRRRSGGDIYPPDIAELEFIQLTRNHGEFCGNLRRLGLFRAAEDVAANAKYIGVRWFALGKDHLQDAREALKANSARAVFSRSYYAAYNVSKAVRYLVNGKVSLKGDDHGEAPELPDDFPDGDRWAAMITSLYEHRLRADYDNWRSTSADNSLTLSEAVESSEQFVAVASRYLSDKFRVEP